MTRRQLDAQPGRLPAADTIATLAALPDRRGRDRQLVLLHRPDRQADDEQGPNAFGLVRERRHPPAGLRGLRRPRRSPVIRPGGPLIAHRRSSCVAEARERPPTEAGVDPNDLRAPDPARSPGSTRTPTTTASGADGIAQIVVAAHPTMAGKTRDPQGLAQVRRGLPGWASSCGPTAATTPWRWPPTTPGPATWPGAWHGTAGRLAVRRDRRVRRDHPPDRPRGEPWPS
jgi:hypothetical protein